MPAKKKPHDKLRSTVAPLPGEAVALRLIFETSPHGIIIAARDGTIVDANPAAQRILSLSSAQMQGLTTRDPFWRTIHEDGSPFPAEEYPVTLAQRTGAAAGPTVMGVRAGAGDEIRWLDVSATPLFRPGDEAPSEVMATFADITEHKKADAALRASEERFQKVFRGSPVIMTITDLASGRYLDVNDRFCAVSGFARGDAIGKTAAELGWIAPGTREAALAALRETGRLHNREERVFTRAGEERTVLMSGEVLELNRVPCLLSIVSDITDLRRGENERALLQEQVHHLKRMDSIGRLAGGVAHDLNNVLTAVLTLTELQQSETPPGTELHGDLEAIVQACLRGQSTVRGLLDFARVDVPKVELLDLNELILDEVALLARTTLKKAVLSTDLDPTIPPVRGDRASLTHVFMNLCLNAVDAMPQGGTITVRTRRDGDAHLIAEVVDTGHGMPAEVLAKALDPFFTTKPQGEGTGLGLSIVFGSVKAHGGTVDLRSAPGEGTTVSIRLPGAVEADALE